MGLTRTSSLGAVYGAVVLKGDAAPSDPPGRSGRFFGLKSVKTDYHGFG